MGSGSSPPLSQLRDGSIALSVHQELQEKVNQLITRYGGARELESSQPAQPGPSLLKDFKSKIWPRLSSDYEKLVNELVSFCRDGLLRKGVRCLVYGRTKTALSVSDSLKRREQERQTPFTDLSNIFYEMHDLAGVMIVAQSDAGVDRANEFVSESFQAIKKPNHWSPERPVGQYWDAHFGSYESCNHHVSLKGDAECSTVIFEVQVTTFKDFIYNQYAHPWFYKGCNGSVTKKDEIIMDMIHGASYLIEMGGEYFSIREKENRDSIEVEHDLFQANRLVNGTKTLKNPRRSQTTHPRSYNTRTKKFIMTMTDKILKAYQYDSNMVTEDCNNILRMLGRSQQLMMDDDVDEERVLAIQSHQRLRGWLALDEPSMLLLDGRGSLGPRSEASLVSAKIACALLKVHSIQVNKRMSPTIISLNFFCGEHRDPQRDPNANATELALSLLLQLVEHGRGFIAPESLQRIPEVVDPTNSSTVYASLSNLITELPSNVYVVIIIDGLKFFTRSLEQQEETKELVVNLVSVFRQGPLATLKLLFTGPSRASSFESLFQEDEILRLSKDLPTGAAVNDLTWRRPLVLR